MTITVQNSEIRKLKMTLDYLVRGIGNMRNEQTNMHLEKTLGESPIHRNYT